jgi:hypothetical protein
VNVTYLDNVRPAQFVCSLSELYREDLSQRFAGYLARIGLPELVSPAPLVIAGRGAPIRPLSWPTELQANLSLTLSSRNAI